MHGQLKPIYLFADSQLFFWETEEKRLFLESVWDWLKCDAPKAAYIGASNEDEIVFFELFQSAMACVKIHDCRMILSKFSREDQDYLNDADIIVLAGGNVKRGLDIFEKTGMKNIVINKYYEGALIIGVSAGAIQLGMVGWNENVPQQLFETLKLVPFIVGVHEEKANWEILRLVLREMGSEYKAIGLSTGAGLVYHTDYSIEPVRHPLDEFALKDDRIINNLLCPKINGNKKAQVKVN